MGMGRLAGKRRGEEGVSQPHSIPCHSGSGSQGIHSAALGFPACGWRDVRWPDRPAVSGGAGSTLGHVEVAVGSWSSLF